jgi:hypothetical protein
MNRAIVCAVTMAGVTLGIGSGTALAGEYDGNGGYVPAPDRARSACAYSGRDLPDDIEENEEGDDDDFVTGGHVQSYGQWVRAGFKSVVPSPGVACRGNAGAPPES